MSETRTVGDDDSQIVNFEGAHNTSASLTAMLFIDEASKNDTYDDGEDAFPSAAMLLALQAAQVPLPPVLPVPVTLVGPEVHQMMSGALNLATGQISFSGLRAGTYQLRVGSLAASLTGLPAAAVAVLRDYEYGGPTGGYDEIVIGVGEAATHAIPVDITHTTAHFTVTLKSGDARGMPVPGATVTLSSGDSGMTGDNGLAMIRFARTADMSDNMVNATVAVDGYHVADGMTPVAWDPKSAHTQGTNANDIVNLTANFSFSGATITTAHPESGQPLAGWTISVMSGADAVVGAPSELGADGSESVSEAVGAGDLPKTYTIAVADDQTGEDGEGNELDGGENYTAEPLPYVHDGLSLAGGEAADAGTLEVTYTTQTLKVYVHEESDQVLGYTGNVQGGDERMSGMVDVEIRFVENGARHQFEQDDSIKSSNKDGVYTFSNVPADRDIIAIADKAADTLNVMVLDPDEVPAYTGVQANGIMKGAFGAALGGFSHTVELCPLMSSDTDQRFREDNCGTFGFVETHEVTGQVWKNVVTKYADDFQLADNRQDAITTEGIPGFTVGMDPVDGENLANESADPFEAVTKANKKFDFDQMPAGVYEVAISGDTADWKVQRGPADDPTDDLADRISPLDSVLNIDVSPKTGVRLRHRRGCRGPTRGRRDRGRERRAGRDRRVRPLRRGRLRGHALHGTHRDARQYQQNRREGPRSRKRNPGCSGGRRETV